MDLSLDVAFTADPATQGWLSFEQHVRFLHGNEKCHPRMRLLTDCHPTHFDVSHVLVAKVSLVNLKEPKSLIHICVNLLKGNFIGKGAIRPPRRCWCRIESTHTMQSNVGMRKFTVYVRKNRAPH